MRFSAFTAVAAAVLVAVSVPALATSGSTSTMAVDTVSTEVVSAEFDFGMNPEIDDHLCHGRKKRVGLELAVREQLDARCSFFSVDLRRRMDTSAHQRLEMALDIYADTVFIMRHTLMTEGIERLRRLVQVGMLIQDGRAILKAAVSLNNNDVRTVRRGWIDIEIALAMTKFERAEFYAKHMPNLCLAQEIFHFVVDASVAVVRTAVSIPIVVGVAITVAIQGAVHLVARAFHYMAHTLHWIVKEIEYAFLMFRHKAKRFLKKVGAGIQAGAKAIGHGLHKLGHEIKEGFEDAAAIIVDIGHHLHRHHHCHAVCHDVVDDNSAKCSCNKGDDGYATITQVCMVNQKICTEQTFITTIEQYDIELAWTEEDAQTKVVECAKEVYSAVDDLRGEFQAKEVEYFAEKSGTS